MYLQRLKLIQFKNYTEQEVEFSERLNCLVGKNGMGKTNLLDAIYYLCMCKSYFSVQDRNAVQYGESFFRVEGDFLKKEKKHRIVAKVIPQKRKIVSLNEKPYKRLSEHIGLLPIVLIAPDDTMLIREGSEERRRFLDQSLSQINPTYLEQLIIYNRVLKQRNAALKQLFAVGSRDKTLVESYNQQLLKPSAYIFETRRTFLEIFNPIFKKYYKEISKGAEQAECVYKSMLWENEMSVLLQENFEKDYYLQRTTKGIHRDDLVFTLNKKPLKRFASQGQMKSYILALKLTQFELLKKEKGVTPILLLDDIFDKLDKYRVEHLLNLLLEKKDGQIFITDTHENRVEQIIQGFNTDYCKFVVVEGKIEL